MKVSPTLVCRDERRRQAARNQGRNGIDYVEIVDDAKQTELCVHLFQKVPESLTAANVRIVGGRRIRDIHVVGLRVEGDEDSEAEACFCVTVDKPGDFSVYKLCLVALDEDGRPTKEPLPDFDQRYACAEFSFKAGCPSDLDCKAESVCPPEKRDEPETNYLAKDYASFRQLILDRLALIMPDWQERHVPDIGIMLVELLAYIGDYLSYYQDAVATEAYLDTARQRISVRRHARLVDYKMHEGCNARAWVCIETDAQNGYTLNLEDAYLITTSEGMNLPQGSILTEEALAGIPPTAYEVFEALDKKSVTVWETQNRMEFYTWGNLECCLPKGATSASLKNGWSGNQPPGYSMPSTREAIAATNQNSVQAEVIPGHPQAGDVLIFEEIIGPRTGNPADADPSRRHAVRLIRAEAITDPLNGAPVLEIQWAAKDALPFPFCLSSRLPAPDCTILTDISVARGNVILVDSGSTIVPPEDLGQVETETIVGRCECEGSVVEMTYLAAAFRPAALKQAPLTFSQPLTADAVTPAASMLAQDSRQALPQIALKSIPPAPDGTGPLFTFDDWEDPTALAKRLRQPTDPAVHDLRDRLSPDSQKALDQWDGYGTSPVILKKELQGFLEAWSPVSDLLDSHSEDRAFVVEIDNEGRAHLRFGDGELGQQPDAGMEFFASYRVGNGPVGNVPADSITKIVFRNLIVSGVMLQPRNLLPAQGGTAPEPMTEVKLFAPGAIRNQKEIQRAITADDYARIVEREFKDKVQRAGASLRWTGRGYVAQVAIDPYGSETADEHLLKRIKRRLHRYRRVGHDVEVRQAQYVPLNIEMHICVLPHFLRGHVEAALLDVLGNRRLPDGTIGFFHPDNLTFGEGIYLSKLVAVVQAVPGVESVDVTKFEHLGEGDQGERDAGLLPLGPFEVAQLDNDPNFPEYGLLSLKIGGGR